MPKKTKKEKIIAQYRKKLQLISNLSNNPLLLNPQKQNIKIKKESEKEKIIINNEKSNYQKNITNKKNNYFFQDLKKSLFLIFFIIALEISLYFVKFIK